MNKKKTNNIQIETLIAERKFSRHLLILFWVTLSLLQTSCFINSSILPADSVLIPSSKGDSPPSEAPSEQFTIKPVFPTSGDATGSLLSSLNISVQIDNITSGNMTLFDTVLINGLIATLRAGTSNLYELPISIVSNNNTVTIDVIKNNKSIASTSYPIKNQFSIPMVNPFDAKLSPNGSKAYVIGWSKKLIEVTLATGSRRIISDGANGIGAGPPIDLLQTIALNAAGTIAYVGGNTSGLYQFDIATGNRSLVSANGAIGTGLPISWPNGVVLNAAETKAYISDSGAARAVIEVDLATGNRIFKSSDGFYGSVGSGPTLTWSAGIALSTDESKVFVLSPTINSLLSIDLATGVRTVLSGPGVGTGSNMNWPQSLLLNSSQTKAYVSSTSSYELLEIDMATGNRSVISGPGVGNGPLFSQLQGIMKAANGIDFIAVDLGLGELLSINKSTGARSIVKEFSVGSGPDMVSIIASATSSDGKNAFAITYDGLYKIDLATGNRSVLSDATHGTGNSFLFIRDFALNNSQSKAYGLATGTGSINGLFLIDLQTGNRTVLSSSSVGTTLTAGADITVSCLSLTVNGSETIAYITDYSNGGSVIKIDLATGNRSFLSNPAIGTGTNFSFPYGLDIDSSGANLYILDTSLKGIVKVDTATGNRTVVASNSIGTGPAFNSLSNLALNFSGTKAIVGDSQTLLSLDLNTGNRTVVSSPSIGLGTAIYFGRFKKIDTSSPRMITSSGNSLIEVNLFNGDRMVRSK